MCYGSYVCCLVRESVPNFFHCFPAKHASQWKRKTFLCHESDWIYGASFRLFRPINSVVNITPPIFISHKISRYLFLVLVNLGGQANEKIFAPRRGITSVARDFIDLVIVIDSCQDICHRYKTHTWLSVVHPYLRQLVVQALTQHREEAGGITSSDPHWIKIHTVLTIHCGWSAPTRDGPLSHSALQYECGFLPLLPLMWLWSKNSHTTHTKPFADLFMIGWI